MKIDSKTGLLDDAKQIPSPNCDQRPESVVVDLIVIHSISLPPGQFGGERIDELFCNCLDPAAHVYFKEIHQLRVSAHLLIRRSGDITQYVNFNQRAWHAGMSIYQGRQACNDFSIGIELEGADSVPYTDQQYQRLAQVIGVLCDAYPSLAKERVVGHCDVAPGRKSDPGPSFDWARLKNSLGNASVG